MCDKCEEIEAKVARYRRLADGINDKPTIEQLSALVRNLETEKMALHPEPEK
jgi:hypothetical protein